MATPRRQSLNKLARLEKAREALELRRAGRTYDQIAIELGYNDPTTVSRHVREAIREIIQEPAEEVKRIEVDRLDILMASFWRAATVEKDTNAADRVLKIMDRRAKYLGLDAPTKVEAKVSAGDRFRNMSLEEQAGYLREFIPKLQADLAEIENRIAANAGQRNSDIEVREIGDGDNEERAGDGGESADEDTYSASD